MNTYQSVAAIDAYAVTKLYTEAWDNSTFETKTKAGYEATRRIDALNYLYGKAIESQPLSFPLLGQSIIPEDVLFAHAEIAIELVARGNVSVVPDGVISERFAAAGITYDPGNVPLRERANIPSELAWLYLWKYLAPIGGIVLSRVS